MARVLTLYCDVCHSQGVINRTERIHANLNRLYCRCKNPQCGQRWVMILEHSHVTQSSKLTKEGLLTHFISKLSEQDKAEIRELLNQ